MSNYEKCYKFIYIITEDIIENGSGIGTWNTMMLYYIGLYDKNIKCKLINIADIKQFKSIETLLQIKKSLILLNNVTSKKIINKRMFQTLQDNNNKLYMVMHSEHMPRNKIFIVLENYFCGIITVSNKLHLILKQKYPNKHIIYIPNKININASLNTDNTNYINDNDNDNYRQTLSFGFVGRLSIEKNIPLLFYTFKKYTQNNPNIDCILNIFGDTNNKKYGKYINKLAIELNIDNMIDYHGNISNKDEIYNSIDILLLPSVSEGVPYCLIERLFYGIPVVASNVGAIKEVVSDDNGILFDYVNYPDINNIYVNCFTELLNYAGFINFVIVKNGDYGCDYYVNNNKHTCNNDKYLSNLIYPDDDLIIPIPVCDNQNIDCIDCIACNLLKENNKIFNENVDRFYYAIIKCIDTMKKMNIKPIYNDFDINIPIKELLYYDYDYDYDNDNDYDNDYNNEKNDIKKINENEYILGDISNKYGFFNTYKLRNLPYQISFNAEIINEFTFFVCNKNSILPLLNKPIVNGKNNISFRITKPGYYKIGIQIVHSEIKVNNNIFTEFNLLIGDSIIPYSSMSYMDMFDMRVINKSRYESINNSELKDVLFMFITCDLPEYKIKHKELLDFLDTFNYNYIIVKCNPGKTIYDKKSKTLIIDLEEKYENLPRKIINALEWILYNPELSFIKYVYKFDSDFAKNSLNFIPKNYDSYDYHGNLIVNKFIDIWHIGKCNSIELNKTKYLNEFIAPYAGGGYGYILSKKSISILVDNKNEFEEYLYEDKAIGDILYKNNIIVNKKIFSTKIQWLDNSIRVIEYCRKSNKSNKSNTIKGEIIIYTYKNDLLVCILINGFNNIIQKMYVNYNKVIDIKDFEILINNYCDCDCDYDYDYYCKSCENINEEVIKISNKSKFKQIDIPISYSEQHNYITVNKRSHISLIYLIKISHLMKKLDITLDLIFDCKYIKTDELKNIKSNEICNYDIIYF
jgi:glycosyltransferase involved in cell wall biosynthesis